MISLIKSLSLNIAPFGKMIVNDISNEEIKYLLEITINTKNTQVLIKVLLKNCKEKLKQKIKP